MEVMDCQCHSLVFTGVCPECLDLGVGERNWQWRFDFRSISVGLRSKPDSFLGNARYLMARLFVPNRTTQLAFKSAFASFGGGGADACAHYLR
jgi:hypothetical protein